MCGPYVQGRKQVQRVRETHRCPINVKLVGPNLPDTQGPLPKSGPSRKRTSKTTGIASVSCLHQMEPNCNSQIDLTSEIIRSLKAICIYIYISSRLNLCTWHAPLECLKTFYTAEPAAEPAAACRTQLIGSRGAGCLASCSLAIYGRCPWMGAALFRPYMVAVW